MTSSLFAPDSYSARNLFINSERSKSPFLGAGDDETDDKIDESTIDKASEVADRDIDVDVGK